MKAVLLCPGPSLRVTVDYTADVVVGVNRVATARACNFWTCLDSPALKRYDAQVKGEPRLLTREAYRPRFSQRPGPTVEELAAWCPLPFDTYSATAALVLAGWLEASDVDVYGADWTEAGDWDNFRDPDQNRSPARWDRERALWGQVVDWLGGKGTTVRRQR